MKYVCNTNQQIPYIWRPLIIINFDLRGNLHYSIHQAQNYLQRFVNANLWKCVNYFIAKHSAPDINKKKGQNNNTLKYECLSTQLLANVVPCTHHLK